MKLDEIKKIIKNISSKYNYYKIIMILNLIDFKNLNDNCLIISNLKKLKF